jgi:hypothetical protein
MQVHSFLLTSDWLTIGCVKLFVYNNYLNHLMKLGIYSAVFNFNITTEVKCLFK